MPRCEDHAGKDSKPVLKARHGEMAKRNGSDEHMPRNTARWMIVCLVVIAAMSEWLSPVHGADAPQSGFDTDSELRQQRRTALAVEDEGERIRTLRELADELAPDVDFVVTLLLVDRARLLKAPSRRSPTTRCWPGMPATMRSFPSRIAPFTPARWGNG